MVAVDRELLHWTTTNLSSTLIRSPQYDITPHPDSARLNSFSHLEPTTMLAFALSAQEVRDLMSAMEEIHEHALAHVDFAADSFDPLLIQRLMTEGGYPLIFESKHGDFVSSATLIDGQHIRFRYADARMSTRPTSVGSVGSGQSGTSSTSDATTELVVTIYHALEFSSLRKAFDLSNTAFIQSMSGCREW